MSTQDGGFGGQRGRSPGFGSPGNRGQAVNAQNNEVPSMVQGTGRPGQPNTGQRSIFGSGGPAFTQMPNYTPVTREQAEPSQNHPSHAQPPQPSPRPSPQPVSQPAPNYQPADCVYPAAPPQGYAQTPQGYAQTPQGYAQTPQGYAQTPQGYAQTPQGYAQPPQPQVPPQAAPETHHFGEVPDLSNADPAFPDSIFGDFQAGASFESDLPGYDVPERGAADRGAADYAMPDQPLEASFHDPNGPDAWYPDAQFDASGGQAAPMPQGYPPQTYPAQQPQAEPMHGEGVYGHVPPADPSRQLQTVDARLDQPPQIPLGGSQSPAQQAHGLFEAGGDADFMDESQMAAADGRSKLASVLKGRSAVMVGSALLGALAFGGALAVALQYWQGGGSLGDTPVITADASPVKEVPDQPGGKEFPHKNKLIYDRLTNGDTPEAERLVPRQENVAVPALPGANPTAGLPPAVATTDLANPATTQSLPGTEEGGPRKVKTLVVRPDGSVEAPAADAADAAAGAADAAAGAANAAAGAANAAAGAANQAVDGAMAAANQAVAGMAAQAGSAANQAANVMPVPPVQETPAAPAAPQQVAALDPAAAAPAPAAADNSEYVVQLGSNKSQTEALANFADAQQKHPSLLGSYQPIVRKTDLGAKGIWYRLQVGPMDGKDAAYKLCGQLKAQGHGDCLVMAQ